MMAKTSYITAQEAMESGLCDAIEMNEDLNAVQRTNKALSREVIMNFHQEKFLNQKSDTMTKNEAIKILNLDVNATDADVISAMTKAVELNKHTQAELDKLKDKMAKAKEEDDEDKYNKLKAKFDKMEEDVKKNAKEEEDKKKASEDEAKKNAAKDKIVNAIKERGATFTAKQVENFVALAGSDDKNLASVIETINETIVINKAPLIDEAKFEKEKSIVFNLGKSKDIRMHDETGKEVVSSIKEITDTSAIVNHMNNQKRLQAAKRNAAVRGQE
jgi:hypothetical protein